MRRGKPWVVGSAAALLLSMTSVAQAAMVTIRVTGTISGIDGDLSPVGLVAATGDGFEMLYTYESSTPDSIVTGPDAVAFGDYSAGLVSATIRIGGWSTSYAASGANRTLFLADNYQSGGQSRDQYQVQAENTPVSGSPYYRTVFELIKYTSASGPAPTGLLSADLTEEAPDPAAFMGGPPGFFGSTLFLEIRPEERVASRYVLASVDSVSVVPLPAAAWLLLSGLGGLGVMARRKRDRA